MFELLLKNARLLSGSAVDVYVENGRFAKIAPVSSGDVQPAKEVFDCQGMTLLPPFYNCHTHVPMTLLRGYADDLELFPWLNEHIWPAEARLTAEDVYNGSRLAILEMIKSGTVFFNDSYYFLPETIRAAEELGVRCCIGLTWLNVGNADASARYKAENEAVKSAWKAGEYSKRIQIAESPHAIYTVPESDLREIAERSASSGMLVHMHLAETEKELEDCKALHNGMTPFQYADACGLVNERARFAHCVWMNDDDRALAAAKGAVLINNATSNMKLCSGMFEFKAADAAGCRIALGTDGCASNNAHSFFSEMKMAALSAKIQSGDPTAGAAERIFRAATKDGAEAFVADAGEIAEGKVADAMLINTDFPNMVGDYNLISNLVYAAESSCVDSLICDGKFLMKHRVVEGEEEIIAAARRTCDKFR